MKDLTIIKDSINELTYDIKAEIVIADLLENGLRQTDCIVYPDGLFRRRFKKDVSHAELIELNNGQEVLGIHITRESIYDSLPEAIFHGPIEEGLINGHEMAKASKSQRIEEKGSRAFFLPFENEIFFQKVQLELSERKILHKFSENLFNDIFPEFWNLDKSLPKDLVSKLMLFLHYSHKFTGNFQLTAKALEAILDEPVSVKLINSSAAGEYADNHDRLPASVLGTTTLGKDMITGDQSEDRISILEFAIGPLKNTRIEEYLENGPISRFIDLFFSYFIPLDMIPSKKVQGYADEQVFTLGEKGVSMLGYNTCLSE
jgi:hypothetical protein